jgi:hypothetical protein
MTMRRTRIQDYKRIKKAEDLNEVVHDKRRDKRATKKKPNAGTGIMKRPT